MSTTPILGLTELAEAQDSPEVPINANNRELEVLIQPRISSFISSLPGSPANGDRYILNVNTGGGLTNQIAYFSNGWKFITPDFGWEFYSVADGQKFRYEGGSPIGWQAVGDGGGGGGASDAIDVTYDGTATGSTATNVQDAIDNIATIVGGSPTFIGGGGGGSSGNLPAEIMADSPTGYWKCSETTGTTLADSSGGGKDLTLQGTYALARNVLVPSDPTKKYIKFTSGSSAGAFNSSGLGTVPITNNWTVECVVNYVLSNSGQARFFQIFSPHATDGNDNGQVTFFVGSDALLHAFWQHGSRTSEDTGLVIAMPRVTTCHLALVKDASAKTLTLYINGVETTITSYTNETDGGSAATTFGIGTGAGVEAGNANTDVFTIGHVAFYRGVKLSNDRIYAHAEAAGLT